MLANINRDSKKRPNPYSIDDFVPSRTPAPIEELDEGESQAAMSAFLSAIAEG